MDDEQGAGILDTERAIIQHQGGKQLPGNVTPIGWDLNSASPAGGEKRYNINAQINAGQFLTVTLCWDRILDEADGNWTVNTGDTYNDHPAGMNDLGTLPAFDLYVYKGNTLVAQSLSLGGPGGENVNHLHFPVSAAGNDYNIRVVVSGDPAVTKQYQYGLAWWGPQN
ncbi:MAG TPA: hypothetical protein VFA26_11005 [Gemmataceae bacterium]|nr:hypothetical protein [Gemmataceae bacterium]